MNTSDEELAEMVESKEAVEYEICEIQGNQLIPIQHFFAPQGAEAYAQEAFQQMNPDMELDISPVKKTLN